MLRVECKFAVKGLWLRVFERSLVLGRNFLNLEVVDW